MNENNLLSLSEQGIARIKHINATEDLALSSKYALLVKKYISDVKETYGLDNISGIWTVHNSPPSLPEHLLQRINEVFNKNYGDNVYNSMNNITSRIICINYIHDLYLMDIGYIEEKTSVYEPLIAAIEHGAIINRESIYIDVGDCTVIIK